MMEARRLLMRAPLALRLLQQRSSNTRLILARHESYQAAVNPQPPLTKAFSATDAYDPEKGPVGQVPPKVKQLQEFYQTPNGKPIWRKTPFDEFLYRATVVLVTISGLWALAYLWWCINPKPVKK